MTLSFASVSSVLELYLLAAGALAAALIVAWYSGYIVSAPPRVASTGIPCFFANSP